MLTGGLFSVERLCLAVVSWPLSPVDSRYDIRYICKFIVIPGGEVSRYSHTRSISTFFATMIKLWTGFKSIKGKKRTQVQIIKLYYLLNWLAFIENSTKKLLSTSKESRKQGSPPFVFVYMAPADGWAVEVKCQTPVAGVGSLNVY